MFTVFSVRRLASCAAAIVISSGVVVLGMGSAVATTPGTLSIIAGTGNAGASTPGSATSSNLAYPYGVAVDASGNIYIADTNNNLVEKVDTSGQLSIIAGTGHYGAPTPGAATSSDLGYPDGVAVDASGNVYIADSNNQVVEKVDTSGQLSIIAGTGNQGPPTPGPATSSDLAYPYAVAVDASGNVYLTDSNNAVVEKVDTSGQLSIIAGTGNQGPPTPGPATSSNLAYPTGVAVDASGNVYLTDTVNQLVEKVSYVAGQTITFGALAAVTYSATPITLSGSASSGLAVSYSVSGPCSVSGSTLTTTGAGDCVITASQAGNSSFTAASPVTQTLTINPAALSATCATGSRAYGAANPALGPTFSGFVGADNATNQAITATCATAATPASAAGRYPVTCTGPASSTNYTISCVDGTLTVTKAALTVTANNATRPFGAANPRFTATVSGLVNGDSAASAYSGTPSLSTTATTSSHPGTYQITGATGTLTSANYNFAFVPGTLTITKAASVIHPGAVLVTLGNGGHVIRFATLSAALSYGNPARPAVGQKIVFSVRGSTLCSATTDVLGIASCRITALQEVAVVLKLGYTATFIGSQDLTASSGNGGLIKFV